MKTELTISTGAIDEAALAKCREIGKGMGAVICFSGVVREIEEELIDWAWSEHGARCANKARGGKGIAVDSDSVTFLYICHTMRGHDAHLCCGRAAKNQRLGSG